MSLEYTFHVKLPMQIYPEWKSWKDRIRHFTWAWHAVVMGTGAVSALLHNFPYNNSSEGLKVMALIFLFLNLIIFTFVCTCTILRYALYPEIWSKMIRHPAQSLFIGCFPMGAITLINSALAVNQDWGTGGLPFLYTLWVFWWIDSIISYIIAFGMLYAMMVKQNHAIAKMSAVWLLPIVTLIVASSGGGLLATALRKHSTTLALLTSGFSLTMVLIGLSLAFMVITVYLLRLLVHGPPDSTLILSAFLVLGPLGQGGFSLLVNGQLLSELIPLHVGPDFPQSALAGQMIFSGCFCAAYLLFSMGVAWILVALCSIGAVIRSSPVPFSMAYWGLIFPNGVFALLVVQLGKVLDSPFFRAFGAIWSCVTFIIWLCVFIRSIPSFIDGSLFKAPYVSDDLPEPAPAPVLDITKSAVSELQLHDKLEDRLSGVFTVATSPSYETHGVDFSQFTPQKLSSSTTQSMPPRFR
ncbi:voltage-dependent anion channel-domain-containing protein [Cristinia sonorae]|uniref:Voltage-dependent anion channel-domain-containing protein n=1 Tax=Cristinia sonorae TaxID=1940300 RepID=A0A8K0UG88_9AGAR|nr:voltage-dependent anion channel-domain-containing protein [Cristinia sonorae]